MTKTFLIGDSKIHGKGVLAAKPLIAGESVGEGITFEWWVGVIKVPIVTEDIGVWINHSYKPTARLERRDGGWHIVANQNLQQGTEITLNYSDTPWYIQGPLPYYT